MVRAASKSCNTDRVLMTPVGLRFPDALPFEEWQKAGRQISTIFDSTAWCLGDWIIYGVERYSDRYQRAIRAAGLDYQTVRNYAWVARKFEFARRRDTLSFQHHAELAALPPAEQDAWLDQAEKFEWSRNQLRINLQKSRAGDSADESVVRLPPMDVEKGRYEKWQEAAAQVNTRFENWALAVLDEAARATTGEHSFAEDVQVPMDRSPTR